MHLATKSHFEMEILRSKKWLQPFSFYTSHSLKMFLWENVDEKLRKLLNFNKNWQKTTLPTIPLFSQFQLIQSSDIQNHEKYPLRSLKIPLWKHVNSFIFIKLSVVNEGLGLTPIYSQICTWKAKYHFFYFCLFNEPNTWTCKWTM